MKQFPKICLCCIFCSAFGFFGLARFWLVGWVFCLVLVFFIGGGGGGTGRRKRITKPEYLICYIQRNAQGARKNLFYYMLSNTTWESLEISANA